MVAGNQNSIKKILTIDLNFLGLPGAIAAYAIPHSSGIVLVECGPGSTTQALQTGLSEHGYTLSDLSDVFLTHIHLDHAGASGWLARQGARIHVHPVGAPHLVNPEKLLASAGRIYGDQMRLLWGDFLPVPEANLNILQDGQAIEVHGLKILPLDTPGHASHHFAYLYEDVCFSGDITGVRMQGVRHLRLPMPPPEFDPEKWRESLERLQRQDFKYLFPTHFGMFSDPAWHLGAIDHALYEVDAWMEANLPSNPVQDDLNEMFLDWTRRRSLQDGVPSELIDIYEAVNPSWMSMLGMLHYWQKRGAHSS